MNVRVLLSLLGVLALAACAETHNGRAVPPQRLDLSRVALDPGQAQSMINAYRASRGLNPLTLQKDLTRAARRHARDLARSDTISHKGSDGTNPWQRVSQTGYGPQLAAENVGAGQRSFAEVLQGWKDSPGHNRNLLLADATHMGLALETNPDSRYQTFWALVLGTPRKPAIASR